MTTRNDPEQAGERTVANSRDNTGRAKASRGKKRSLGKLLIIGLVILVVLLPRIVTLKPVVGFALRNAPGVQPLSISVGHVGLGWFQPASVSDVQIYDATGSKLVSIRAIKTEKGLIGWLTNSSNLGHVLVSGFEAEIVASDGTTNVEAALAHLFETSHSELEQPQTSAGSSTTGNITLQDSQVVLSEQGRGERWLVSVTESSVTLPGPEEVIGPINAEVTIANVATQGSKTGAIVADVRQADGDGSPDSPVFEVRAMMDSVPLDFWHVVHARFPEIPIEELNGTCSFHLGGSVADEEDWSLDLSQLSMENIRVTAPQLVGPEPANLRAIAGATRCVLAGGVLRLQDTQLDCDFASATAEATIPWPIAVPTATRPFIDGGRFEAEGVVDLPQLVVAAKTLIPIRAGTDLTSGNAQFRIQQEIDADGKLTGATRFEINGLAATANGMHISWDDPFAVEVTATDAPSGPNLTAQIAADFASLQGQGSLRAGKVAGNMDLSALRQRLSQWVELPITQMSGKADFGAEWHLTDQQLVEAQGTLSTTPIVLATTSGRELQEPAWQGSFSGNATIGGSQVEFLNSANVTLQSQNERLTFALHSPLSLRTPVASTEQTMSDVTAGQTGGGLAAFHLDVHADLANCLRRSTVWLEEQPEVDVSGFIQLAASGAMNLGHVEITSANWNGQPVQVMTPQMSFIEPSVVGSFKGRVDSSDLTRTMVEALEMTSSSVSLIAQDSANPDAGVASRVGRARFLVDLGRLMSNTNTGTSSLISAGADGTLANAAQLSANGRCEGELAWQVNSTAAGLNLALQGQDLQLISTSPGQQPSVVWQEPQLSASVEAGWLAETNEVNASKTSLQTQWLNYSGKMTYATQDEVQHARLSGQAVYDCQQLSYKLAPMTGGQVMMAGQQTVPVNVTWTSNGDTSQSALAGLQCDTRLGWQQASVAGIQVGQADVPVIIKDGVLTTAAEIPVSGGVLRWDIHSDLTQDDLLLHQKPMVLCENVQITPEMCKGWLKYVTPLLAEATSVDGRLSLSVDQAVLSPVDPTKQTVAGQLVIHNATVGPGPLSNQVVLLVKQVDAIRKKEFAQAVSSQQRVWMDMREQRIDFQMVNGRVEHRNLSVEIGDATINTRGSVGIEGDLNMIAAMPIPDDWAEKSKWLAGFKGQTLEFPMGGTVTNPQVDSRLLARIGQQSIQNAATGLLQQSINRGLDKILGGQKPPLQNDSLQGVPIQPAGNQPGQGQSVQPPANGAQLPGNGQDALLGVGEQLLRGQGLNLPGLFGGNGQSGGNR